MGSLAWEPFDMEENRRGKPRHGRGSTWGRRDKGRRLDSLLPDFPTRRIPGARCLDQASPTSMPGGWHRALRSESIALKPPPPCTEPSPLPEQLTSRPRLFDPLRETFHSPSRSLGSSRRIRPSTAAAARAVYRTCSSSTHLVTDWEC